MATCRFYSLAVVPALIALSACAVRTIGACDGGRCGAAVCERPGRRRPDGAGHERGALRGAHSDAGRAQPCVRGRAVHDRAAKGRASHHWTQCRRDDSRQRHPRSSSAPTTTRPAFLTALSAEEPSTMPRRWSSSFVSPKRFQRRGRNTRIRIVFFDMEEFGLLGSAQFVQAHRERPMRAMVNLDVNAFGDTLIFGPRAGRMTPRFGHCARPASRSQPTASSFRECRRATTELPERGDSGRIHRHSPRGAGASTVAADERRKRVWPADRIRSADSQNDSHGCRHVLACRSGCDGAGVSHSAYADRALDGNRHP